MRRQAVMKIDERCQSVLREAIIVTEILYKTRAVGCGPRQLGRVLLLVPQEP